MLIDHGRESAGLGERTDEGHAAQRAGGEMKPDIIGWMADVKSSERLTFIRKPGAGLQVDVNGTVKGTIKGDDFAKAFLSIWLGASPPNPDIKTGMLGGACP